VDQELADAAAYAPGRRFVCTHQTDGSTALFCVKLRHGRHLESVTYQKSDTSIDVYLLEEQFCKISSRSDLK